MATKVGINGFGRIRRMVFRATAAHATLLMVMIFFSGAGEHSAMAQSTTDKPCYKPTGMYVWDFWFLKDGDTWHAFHLQSPALAGVPDPHMVSGHPNVGHATSTDLVNWTNRGSVLAPIRNTWNDIMIATGSAVAYDGRYWMVFTGRGTPEGVGLAVSDDLNRWTKIGDRSVFEFSHVFESVWQGETVRWKALADPYIYPEPINGWFYMVINAQVQGVPAAESGCLPMLRSKDLKTWEEYSMLAWPRCFDRLETPQLWTRQGRWYLYAGGVNVGEFSPRHQDLFSDQVRTDSPLWGNQHVHNFYFTADRFDGPFVDESIRAFGLPDGNSGYIAKVIPDAKGNDVMLVTIGGTLSRPYPVTYDKKGVLVIGQPR